MKRRQHLLALLACLVVIAAGCDWAQSGYDASRASFSSGEASITPANVGSLAPNWNATANAEFMAVAGGRLYTTSRFAVPLPVFDAAGIAGCTGASCAPLWSNTAVGSGGAAPAVSAGREFVTSVVGSTVRLTVFDAAGVTGCTGTPKVCSPLWTASAGSTTSQFAQPPTVDHGRVYVSSGVPDGIVSVFDASGTANCNGTTHVCTPLFRTPGDAPGAIAVANGSLDVGGRGHVSVYPADGIGCAPVCLATRTLAVGGPTSTVIATPSVSGGRVLVNGDDGTLRVFDDGGTIGCAGTPKVCQPMWSATAGISTVAPAAANGVVYVTGEVSGSPSSRLFAFDAGGVTGCAGSPKVCAPLWTAPLGGLPLTPRVIAKTLFVSATSGVVAAYDPAGTQGCSGSPRVCAPLWSTSFGNQLAAVDLVVADGTLFLTPAEPGVRAFRPT